MAPFAFTAIQMHSWSGISLFDYAIDPDLATPEERYEAVGTIPSRRARVAGLRTKKTHYKLRSQAWPIIFRWNF